MDIKTVALGSIYTMISRLVILACGFAVTITLARHLGPDLFGVYSVILSLLVWVEQTVSMGIPSVYRKVISEDPASTPSVLAAVKRYSLPWCLGVTAIYCVLSPLVAWGMADWRLVVLLLVSSIDIPVFGLYATYMGVLNGRGRFFSQSLLAVVYAVSRTLVIAGAVVAGFGVVGALVGNGVGSLLGLLMALFLVRRMAESDSQQGLYGKPCGNLEVPGRMRSYGLPYLANYMIASVLIHMDIWLVKALTVDRETVDAVVGFYAVAYNLARIPFFLIGAVTFTVFPAVSKAAFQNLRAEAQEQITHSLRMVLVIVLPMVAVVLTTGERMIVFLFSEAYLPAATAFKILFGGVSLFSVFLFFVAVIAAENRVKASLSISLGLLPFAIGLHAVLIPAYGIEGAAAVTSVMALAGVTLAGAYVRRRFGTLLRVRDVTKLLLANGSVYLLSQYDGLYQYHLIAGYVLLAAVYLFLLVGLKVIDPKAIREAVASLGGPSRELP